MVKHGIRINDWSIIRRNNRFFDESGTVSNKRQELSIQAPEPEMASEPMSGGGDNSANKDISDSTPKEFKQD